MVLSDALRNGLPTLLRKETAEVQGLILPVHLSIWPKFKSSWGWSVVSHWAKRW